MNKYEAMFIIKADLSEADKGNLFNQLSESIVKHKGSVSSANIWSEKRKLCFPIKKQQDGVYYLMNFSIDPAAIVELENIYKLNEFILRVMITKL